MEANDKKIYKKGIVTGLLIALIVVILIVIGVIIYSTSSVLNPATKSKIAYLTSLIEQTYYDDVDIDELREGMYGGLVDGLGDKYSKYYSPAEASAFNAAVQGEFCGLGATLSQDSDGIVRVRKVYSGSAAEEIGLRVGDIIIAADDKKTAEMELTEFTSYTRGKEGTSFVLTYKSSDSDEEKKADVTRKKVEIPSVAYKMLDGDIGYIEITEFSKKTYDEYMVAINDLQSQGAVGVVFDLRFNGGGIVDGAVAILDEILPKCRIVSVQQKGKGEKVYDSDSDKVLDMPIVVLVSGRTASAAEIFAGAIRDNNYGTLIGYKTYGKGVVQTSASLKDGSVISITSGRYFTPSGECINEKGIEPDIQLDFEYDGDENDYTYDEMKDNQVVRAIEVIRGNN